MATSSQPNLTELNIVLLSFTNHRHVLDGHMWAPCIGLLNAEQTSEQKLSQKALSQTCCSQALLVTFLLLRRHPETEAHPGPPEHAHSCSGRQQPHMLLWPNLPWGHAGGAARVGGVAGQAGRGSPLQDTAMSKAPVGACRAATGHRLVRDTAHSSRLRRRPRASGRGPWVPTTS